MTRDERRAASAAIARRERVEQGLPEQIDDPAFYAFVGRMLDKRPLGGAA